MLIIIHVTCSNHISAIVQACWERTFSRLSEEEILRRLHHPKLMGVMAGSLISCSKQSREQKQSARPGQLGRIRGADTGQIGGDLRSHRCIVTNRNRMPGYRDEQEAESMDSKQKSQNGRGDLYGGECSTSGHSLMSMLSLILLAMTFLLPQCTASNPCSEYVAVAEEWRDVSKTQEVNTDNCDKESFLPDKWYSFKLGNQPASIPTQCIKNNMCGSKIAMRVDLLGQELPETVGENITAALCGSYDILGKYDCCVLRREINIARCENDLLIYNFPSPFDRCPVAVCAQAKDIEVPPAAIARMGEDVSTEGVLKVTDTTLAEEETTFTTTHRNEPDTSLRVDETSDTHFPPQPLLQQTTDSVSTASASENHISTTESRTESISSAIPTDISELVETTNKNQTTTVPMETESVTENSEELEEGDPDIIDLDPRTTKKDLPMGTSSVSPMSSSLLTSTETVTTDTRTSPFTSLEMASDTSIGATSADSLLSTISKSADDLSATRDYPSDDLLSNTTTASSDILSTTDKQFDLLPKTSRLSSDGSTSDSPHTDVDTVVNTTKLVEFADTKPASSSLAQTTETKTTDILDSETLSTLDFDLTSTIATRKPTTAARTSQASTTTKTTESLVLQEKGRTDDTKLSHPGTGDVKLTETVRLVFKGEPERVVPTATVLYLLDDFLEKVSHNMKTEDDFDWTFELRNVSGAMNFENRKTYMDFEVTQTSNDYQKITDIFTRFQIRKFVFEKSNMTLLAECRAQKNCQYDSFEGAPRRSVFQENAPAFITGIIVCSVCLLILVIVLLYARLSKRGSWKAPDAERQVVAENRRHYNGNQSPFTDDQIMKDEMVDKASFNGSAKDGDTNLNSTWVVPLDQDPSLQKREIAIATEDTKF